MFDPDDQTLTTSYRVFINGVAKRTTNPSRLIERTDGAIVLDAVAGILYLCNRFPSCKRLKPNACALLAPVMRRPGFSAGPDDWDDDEITGQLTPGNYRVICCRLNSFFSRNGYGNLLSDGDSRQHYLLGGYVHGRKLPRGLPYPIIVIEHQIATFSS